VLRRVGGGVLVGVLAGEATHPCWSVSLRSRVAEVGEEELEAVEEAWG